MKPITSAQNQQNLNSLVVYMLGVYEGAFNCCERHVQSASQFPKFLATKLYASTRYYVQKQELERFTDGKRALEGDELEKFGAVHRALAELIQDMNTHAKELGESITWGDELHASLMNAYKFSLTIQ